MTDTGIFIMAHGKAQATFDRHLPYWEAHGLPITVLCPKDDVVKTWHHVQFTGYTSHCGTLAKFRLIQTLELLHDSSFSDFWVFEYDAICLSHKLPEIQGHELLGMLKINEWPDRFLSQRYVIAPWHLDRWMLDQIYVVRKHFPAVFEEGYQDRLISAWAMLAGVPILPLPQIAMVQNTIQKKHYAGLHQAILNGGRWIHGIKDEKALAVAQNAYNEALRGKA